MVNKVLFVQGPLTGKYGALGYLISCILHCSVDVWARIQKVRAMRARQPCPISVSMYANGHLPRTTVLTVQVTQLMATLLFMMMNQELRLRFSCLRCPSIKLVVQLRSDLSFLIPYGVTTRCLLRGCHELTNPQIGRGCSARMALIFWIRAQTSTFQCQMQETRYPSAPYLPVRGP